MGSNWAVLFCFLNLFILSVQSQDNITPLIYGKEIKIFPKIEKVDKRGSPVDSEPVETSEISKRQGYYVEERQSLLDGGVRINHPYSVLDPSQIGTYG